MLICGRSSVFVGPENSSQSSPRQARQVRRTFEFPGKHLCIRRSRKWRDRCWSQSIVKSSILGFSRQFLKTFATVYPDATDRAPGSPRMGYRRKKFARTLIQLPTLKILTQLQSSKPRNQLMTPNNLTLKIVSQMCSKHSIKSGRFDIFFYSL